MSAAPFDAAAVANAAKAREDDGTETELMRAAELDRIEYARKRKDIAERLNLPVATLDAEISDRRRTLGKAEGQGQRLALVAPAPWPDPVDGATLLDGLRADLAAYVVMPPGSAETVALWILHAHALDAFGISPRLAITSPEKGCGKTTLLDVVSKLVPRPLPTANAGAAAVFRVIEAARPTLLIDEADTFLDSDDGALRGILNSGHRRGGAVIRCVGDDNEARTFGTFGACAIAKIGRLPGTLEDRAVAVELRRATGDEKPRRFRYDRTQSLDRLACMAARWAADNRAALAEADPTMPEALHNRAADNWRPLLAIADAAGGAWPARARAIAAAAVNAHGDDGSIRTRLLADIRAAFREGATDRIASVALCEALAGREDAPWAEWKAGKPMTPIGLAKLLAPFKVLPRTIRLASGATPKGYLLADFAESFARYLPPDPGSRNATPPQASNGGHFSHSENATTADPWRLGKDQKPANGADCGGVAFPRGASEAVVIEEGEL
jgi:putative DNA primase/helicase